MRNGRKKDEEKKEFVPIKNRDYFEFKDGVYFTIEALCKKYDCQHTHIYRRRKEFDIPQQVVFNTTVIKDSEHFNKLPKAMNLEGNIHKITSYAALHKSVIDMLQEFKEFRHTQINWNTLDNQAMSELTYAVRENSKLLKEILNHLTQTKVEVQINE